MNHRVLIVGMNPSTRERVLKNSTFDRMLRWMDLLSVDYFSFMNAYDLPGPVNGQVPNRDALIAAAESHRKVVALGGVAADALRKCGVEFFRMPHPSPKNRQLNSKEYELEMIEKCERYLNDPL